MITPSASGDALPTPHTSRRPTPFPWLKLFLAAVGLIAVALLLVLQDGVRFILALSMSGVLFFLVMRAPGSGIPAVLLFLALLGGIRRFLIPYYAWSGTDPLLLTSGLTVTLALLMRRQYAKATPLSRLMLGLICVMVVEIVNPIQGGLIVGLSGALIYVVPLMWFFVTRRVATMELTRNLFLTIIGIAFVGALYGFYQTNFGFSEGEKLWLKTVGSAYEALNIGNVTRPFAFFTSAAEYSRFLGFGVVLIWAFWLRGRRSMLLLLPPIAAALFLESVRTSIVSALVACVVLWAVQSRAPRTWLVRSIPALILAAIGTVWGLQQVQVGGFSQGTQDLAAHSIAGLTDPNHSTAPGHFAIFVNGVWSGFRNPIGAGLGSTSIAGDKFGGTDIGTEYDISNMFVSLGFIGGLLYVLVIWKVLTLAFRYWARERSLASLGILGVLVFGFLQWLNGGEYATSMLIWVCIGLLDHFMKESPRRVTPPHQPLPAQERLVTQSP